MTDSATKQSIPSSWRDGLLRFARNDETRLPSCLSASRAKSNFHNRINAIPPVQSPSAKIFPFALAPNHIHIAAIPSH
jgi:hypothetical protein